MVAMCLQAQAAGFTQGLGHSRRWTFDQMQDLKGEKVETSIDEEHKLTEIFVMLPLDIIAVGEVTEGGHCLQPPIFQRGHA